MPPYINITIEQLRGMIGLHVRHEGMICRVIEVLEDGPSIVLMDARRDMIQTNQFGNPGRRVPETYTVPVLTAERSALHPRFLALDLIDG
ncbi:MAG: hypothetical protein P8076_12410 [Gammaproteobacteria bacterium]|jgi:hypothetical protein